MAASRRAALLAATALVASGCSAFGGDGPEAVARPGTVTSAESGLRQGPYAIETSAGAVITFDLPTDPAPDQEVEELRQDLRVEPVTYVAVHIDNTKGTRTVEISDLKVISHEGGLFPFETAADVLAEWDPDRSVDGGFSLADGTDPGPEKGAELDRRTHELMASYPGTVPAGGTGEELLIGDFARLPATFDDVELTAYANERAEDPAPVGHGPEELRYKAQPGDPEVPEREPAEAAAPEPLAPEPVAPGPVVPDPLEGAGVPPEPADDDVAPEPDPLPAPPAEAPAPAPEPTLPIEEPATPPPPPPPPPGPGQEPLPEPTPSPSQEPTPAPLPVDPSPAPEPGPVLPETPVPTELPTAGNAPTTPAPDAPEGTSGPDPTVSASAAPTVSASAAPTVSASAAPTVSASASAGATADPTSSSTPSALPSATPSTAPSATSSATPSADPSPAASLPVALEQA